MRIYWLLVFVPLAILARVLNAGPVLVFGAAFVAMVPLAFLISEAVDALALYTGPSIGALLAATFGTLTEIFILLHLLRLGQRAVMQAEITGSVLLGLLLVIGLSEVVGGLKHGFQEYDARSTALATSLMALAVMGMFIPTLFAVTEQMRLGLPPSPSFQDPALDALSIGVALVLIALYGLYLVFLYRYVPKRPGFSGREVEPTDEPEWSRGRSLALLGLATLGMAVISGILTDALEPFGEAIGLSTLFLGLIVLPIAGGFADFAVATRAARNDQIGLSFALGTGVVLQTALLVAPLMVLVSPLTGDPLTLSFGFTQVIAMGLAVAAISLIASDGLAHWFAGAQCIALYGIMALWFLLTSG